MARIICGMFFVCGLLASAESIAGEPPSALCTSIRAELEQTITAIHALPALARARKLDAFDYTHENPESCNVDRIIEVQDEAELVLVQLDASGTKIKPEKVFRCTRLEGKNKQCNGGFYGDDTWSTREFRVHTDPVPQTKTVRIESQWDGARLECVFVLSIGKGHPTCGKNPVLPRPESGTKLVAIYRVGGHVPLRKYVWSID